jgi:hypothetical protein
MFRCIKPHKIFNQANIGYDFNLFTIVKTFISKYNFKYCFRFLVIPDLQFAALKTFISYSSIFTFCRYLTLELESWKYSIYSSIFSFCRFLALELGSWKYSIFTFCRFLALELELWKYSIYSSIFTFCRFLALELESVCPSSWLLLCCTYNKPVLNLNVLRSWLAGLGTRFALSVLCCTQWSFCLSPKEFGSLKLVSALTENIGPPG